jgi:predicted enzyme related to lactoylglutathione lyase
VHLLARLARRGPGGRREREAARALHPTAWSSWVVVDDVAAAAERCREAGGQVRYGPDEIPGMGRFAVLSDPWGAVLVAFRATGGESARPAPGPGRFCWETLVTPEPAAAAAFYGKVVGFGTRTAPGGGATASTSPGSGWWRSSPTRAARRWGCSSGVDARVTGRGKALRVSTTSGVARRSGSVRA